jgi:8-oxo-(d)GTP phosphatase
MTNEIRAAGAVLWRAGPEILLVHRPKYDDWSLPKGKQEPGEHILQTAVREVLEETSVRPVLGPRLRPVFYLVRGAPKRVDYWSAPTDVAAADHEIDAVAWLPLAQAVGQLSYAHDRDVLAGLVPRPTVPLILLRHASAGPKAADDLRRPLDAHGEADAVALAGLLACFAPHARVISSPAVRCTETVRPYAELTGVEIETDDVLITNSPASPSPLIRALVTAAQPAIVCLHRENLAVALNAACEMLDAEVPEEPGLPKGGFWVVHAAAGQLVTADRYDALSSSRSGSGSAGSGWAGSGSAGSGWAGSGAADSCAADLCAADFCWAGSGARRRRRSTR